MCLRTQGTGDASPTWLPCFVPALSRWKGHLLAWIALLPFFPTSALDYEETWERADLSSMDLGLLNDANAEKDGGSE
jgi:hypothetical protein